MATKSKRYILATAGDKRILLSPSSGKIIKVLSNGDSDFSDLAKRTHIGKASLYVFILRLVKAGLVKKTPHKDNSSTISLKTAVTLQPISVVG